MRYPVRCCCTPERVLGWLHLPSGLPSLVLVPEACGWTSGLEAPRESQRTHLIELRVATHADGSSERVVYDDDRPMAFWLQLSGFEPNTEAGQGVAVVATHPLGMAP